MKNRLNNNKNTGYIILDLSKAFGEMNRNKPWRILYEKGIPIELLNMVKWAKQ